MKTLKLPATRHLRNGLIAPLMCVIAACGLAGSGSRKEDPLMPPDPATGAARVASVPERARFVGFASDGGFYATLGSFERGDWTLVKFDTGGSRQWLRPIYGDPVSGAVAAVAVVGGDIAYRIAEDAMEMADPSGEVLAFGDAPQRGELVGIGDGLYSLDWEVSDGVRVSRWSTDDLSKAAEVTLLDPWSAFRIVPLARSQGLFVSCDCSWDASIARLSIFDLDLEPVLDVELETEGLDEMAIQPGMVLATYDDGHIDAFDGSGLRWSHQLEYEYVFDLVALADGGIAVSGDRIGSGGVDWTSVFDLTDSGLELRWEAAVSYDQGNGTGGLIFADGSAIDVRTGLAAFTFDGDIRSEDQDPVLVTKRFSEDESVAFWSVYLVPSGRNVASETLDADYGGGYISQGPGGFGVTSHGDLQVFRLQFEDVAE